MAAVDPESNDQQANDVKLGKLSKKKFDQERYLLSKEAAANLIAMGLGKYLPLFNGQNISMENLQRFTHQDLQALGVADEEDRRKIIIGLRNRRELPPDVLEDLLMAENVLDHMLLLNKNLAILQSRVRNVSLYRHSSPEGFTGKKLMELIESRSSKMVDIIRETRENQDLLACPEDPQIRDQIADARRRKERKATTRALTCIVTIFGLTASIVFMMHFLVEGVTRKLRAA